MRLRPAHSGAVCVLLCLAGCANQVTSPPLSGGVVAPDLVCAEQLTTHVVVTGDGFTPMPIDTLTAPKLRLPSVQLTQTRTLTGAAASGTLILPGDPASPGSSAVSWQSEQQLTFDVSPALALAPGLYDVTVTNPDGKAQVTVSPGLTAVPAPVLLSVDRPLFCDAQAAQTIVLTGTGFLTVGGVAPTVRVGTKSNADFTSVQASGCTLVPGSYAEGTVATCLGLTVVLPAALLEPGDYALSVTNPAPANCQTSQSMALHILPPPALSAVDKPGFCDAQNATTLQLSGTGFVTVGALVPTVQIGTRSNADFTSVTATGCTPTAWTLTQGAVSLCTGLTVVLPVGLLPLGQYPVTVTNPAPVGCTTTQTVTVSVEPPPLVLGSRPASICQGGGTITIAGENFLPQATVSLVGTDAGLPPITTTATAVNDAGTSITASFGGGGALTATYDVVVDNGDGCRDRVPHRQLTIVAGPVAFFADPEVVFNGIATRVTVYVTTLLWPAANTVDVTLTPHGAAGPQTALTGLQVAGHPNRAQVVIPTGQAPGAYDLTLTDASGCPATLSSAITVTNATTIALKDVLPPFGYVATRTDVTVRRDTAAAPPNNDPFVATPRLFLNPVGATATDVAIQVESVSFGNGDTLTAVVPANQPARHYDLIVVNPNGKVGFLANAFNLQASPPPVVTSVTPASLLNAGSNAVTIDGTNFSAGATASLTCRVGAGATTTTAVPLTGAPACLAQRCTVAGTIAGGGLSVGATCLLRLTNTDGSYFDFSSLGVTDTPGNLSSQAAGSALTKGRRAVVAGAGNATGAARFVYAIGGDSGSAGAAAPFADAEFASVDLFGAMGPWAPTQRSALNTGRAFAGSASVGRYIYLFGGTDGAAPLASAERAMILDPTEVPQLDVSDIVPAATGLDPGVWIYRVSARLAAGDADNPGGESLASSEVIVRVPTFAGRKIQVLLSWAAPADALGAPIPNVVGYDVYRTPVANGVSGTEIFVATVAAPTQTWTDDGSAPVTSTRKPLPLGSLGAWKVLPALTTARQGLGSAAAFDPVTADRFYLYALAGRGAGNALLTSYELLPVTVQPNGHQTVSTWATGAHALGVGRWQLGAWVADHAVSSTIAAGTTYVYAGGGLTTAGTFDHTVESGQVAAGGDLGVFASQQAFTADLAGYSPNASAGTLFAWGGSGAVPASDGHSAVISGAGPTLAAGAWNSVGGINLGTGRYLAGSTVQSAFFFVVGGANVGTGADPSTLLMVW